MSTAFARPIDWDKKTVSVSTTSVSDGSVDVPPLGDPANERRFWWQRRTSRGYDPENIATLPSVFDDPDTADKYQPPENWENIKRFDPRARWTWREEYALLRKIDLRIMSFACIMFIALELDRSNLGQALSDNFLTDLGLTTNGMSLFWSPFARLLVLASLAFFLAAADHPDYNLGNTVRLISFLCAEIPSQLVSKWMGPDRWIPLQMCLWSIVAGSQFWLQGRSSFLATRALLGILQGGFIPDVILYLSYFYKHSEMALRLSWFWGMDTGGEIIADILAYGILHLRGVHGLSGWRWLFLIEGIITLLVGLLAFLMMPAGPCQTASWFRGKNGWFTPREETIIVNRVLRDDPSKSGMHNRQPVTPKLLWKSLCDYDLWPLYMIGMLFEIPSSPPSSYLTLSLRGLGFTTFQVNLLAIPLNVLSILTMFLLAAFSEWSGQLTLSSLFAQVWVLPFLVWLEVAYSSASNKWVVYAVMTLFLSQPYAHPIQVSWNSRNSNTVRSRTVSAAAYNMFVQLSGIISAQIYRADDAPLYRRGNKVLLGILALNFVVYGFAKVYYVKRNQYRDRVWNGMTEEQRLHYLATTTDEGNKRLDFRFAH
ncbi:uncharacterized protein SPSK_06066 [Sporothrix schenckii 1099-18]|uniref:MFS transporter n=1 Tax=Sporothrix schenckii 1099-18 TaxID=1397361 RepID=A0A0F2MI12_SPOSC|nr:uncharacterized protein SPSK_06066 [Sporothrix schenckii 1099-18]KJR89272.1 hypothetical protein SPSK_06066 [Sporothrix schenckii 1099-18]